MMYSSSMSTKTKWVFISAFTALAAVFFLSLASGQYPVPLEAVWHSFLAYDPHSIDHIVIQTTRLSRTFVAGLVGASLAVSGVLMQALTRNPLAAPSIFGVNAGAVFFIVLCSSFSATLSAGSLLWIAFFGATMAGGLVYGIGFLGRDGLSPVKIVLSGVAISSLFVAFTQGILVLGQEGLDSVLFWMAGSVSGRSLDAVGQVLPYTCLFMFAAILCSPHINVLLSGDDIAKGLGQNTLLIKTLLSTLIIGLAGIAVSLAGNIGFIGLIVPHMVRAFTGNDHRSLIPLSALWGAILLMLADIIGRFVIAPEELPIGVLTAILGVPFFIYLARKGKSHV
ncbi:ABC-type transporter, integral membrane subunit [Marinomonas mediterranea MMB-1]|uniref:ABC-type transporter, integral membrane subunit n=2 Tax=Marinomonas mediterranea TaxID=119864 RepID=F2JYQ8_MARM1|nr:ABC-type transporter, integral membrane subunit [Marinomonas mediterranea MMB-1]